MSADQIVSELLTVAAAAKHLSVSQVYLRRLVRERRLGAVRIGRALRIPLVELGRLVEAGYVAPREPDA